MMSKQLLDDIKRSGLNEKDLKKLGYKLLTAEETKEITDDKHKAVLSYKIPYYDIEGKVTPFYRIRFLEDVQDKSKGFGKSKAKPMRYWQPPKAVPQIYFPNVIKWSDVVKDIEIPIYITEGEKKAAKACAEGLYCIGLGGVWNWKSSKKAVPLIKDFDDIGLKGRTFILVFDSDSNTNINVMKALHELTKVLTNKGAIAKVVELPELEEEKQGLDDYLVREGIKEFTKLPQSMYPQAEELWKLNDEICYIEETGTIYHFDSNRHIMSKNALVGIQYANRTFNVFEGEKLKAVNAAEEWLKWRFRRVHSKIVYEPGQPRVIEEDNSYNMWTGWGVEPEEGDCQPWRDLLNYVFQNNIEHIDWFERWLAYPLQHPGTKLFNSVLIHGLAQGTGKSFIGYIMGDIYGQNFSVVSQDELESDYNTWLVNKQFVLGEEITGTDKRREADKLKNMMTREKVYVNEKFQPNYHARDCVNYLLTSNHPDALFIENSDRRVFVHEVVGEPESKQFYKRIDKWRKSGGARYLMHYLLNLDLADFSPKEAPPSTEAKRDMISLSKSDLDLFAEQLKTSPDDILKMGSVVIDRSLYTMDEIINFYSSQREGGFAPTKIAMSKSLRRQGFKMMAVTVDKKTKKLWGIRNSDKWNRATHPYWANEYAKYLDKKPGSRVISLSESPKTRKF